MESHFDSLTPDYLSMTGVGKMNDQYSQIA